MSDPFVNVRVHVQPAGSSLAAALAECDALAEAIGGDAGLAGDLVAIRRSLIEAARLLSKAEVLTYPIPE